MSTRNHRLCLMQHCDKLFKRVHIRVHVYYINMEKSVENAGNPLPLRYAEVKEKRSILDEGIVPVSEDIMERYDISNAAQSIVIDRLESELIAGWESPDLDLEGFRNFYHAFAVNYYLKVKELEVELWQDLVQSVVSKEDLDINNLSPEEAAILTLANLSEFEFGAASSQELFMETALYARVYENILKEKLGDEFSNEMFEKSLQDNMPNFQKRLISLDTVIIDYVRANVMKRENGDESEYINSDLDPRCLEVDDDTLQLRFKPKLLQLFKNHAAENSVKEDSMGRTVSRGCPFLVSNIRDELIRFVVEELISQRRIHT